MTARALLAEARTIARRLNGSVAHGAHQGDRYERDVCGKQMADAARVLNALAAAIDAQPDSEAADRQQVALALGPIALILHSRGFPNGATIVERAAELLNADAARGEPREGDTP